MDRLDGIPLTDGAAIRKFTGGRDPQQILINALNVWFGSILQAPSFHADVHQGGQRCLSATAGQRPTRRNLHGRREWASLHASHLP